VEPSSLEIDQILEILPHRWPFVMVDRVQSIVPFERIRAHKSVSMNEPWFQGHFPGRAIMPGVLILEALAQAGALLAHASAPFDKARSLVYLASIDKAKFRKPVTPGDRLDLDVHVLHHRANVWKLKGEAFVDNAICAHAELLASVVERS
jgi:3-hydroxyacyl-[acyl-carrier-protein] dehydratase